AAADHARGDHAAADGRGCVHGAADHGPPPPALAISRARREAALAARAELELARLQGELVNVAEARLEVIAAYTLVRTRLLGIPARARQRSVGFSETQLA